MIKSLILTGIITVSLLLSYARKQPSLSNLEKGYMVGLSEECGCDVTREVDSGLLTKSKKKGYYRLQFNHPSGIALKDSSLWKSRNSEIVHYLYYGILHEDTTYNKVVIVHQYQSGDNTFYTQAYICSTDTLVKGK